MRTTWQAVILRYCHRPSASWLCGWGRGGKETSSQIQGPKAPEHLPYSGRMAPSHACPAAGEDTCAIRCGGQGGTFKNSHSFKKKRYFNSPVFILLLANWQFVSHHHQMTNYYREWSIYFSVELAFGKNRLTYKETVLEALMFRGYQLINK